MSEPIEITAVALNAHDADVAAQELYEQLTLEVVNHIHERLGEDRAYSPEEFAEALARSTRKAIVAAFHIGRHWQEASSHHQRIHDLEHGGSNN